MITASSSVVNMPAGHYAKISQVIRHLVKHQYKQGECKYRKPRYPRTRPKQPPKSSIKAAGIEWKERLELTDPDGLTELWIR